MQATTVLAVLAGACVIWHVTTSIRIYEYLRRRGQKVSFLWLRVMAPWYASRYKKITKTETGRTGPLFYHWIISINAALLVVIIFFIMSRF